VIREAKGGRERMVYLSDEVLEAPVAYLLARLPLGPGPVFLNEKGPWKGQGLSVRGIQKRLEAYASRSGVEATCHRLCHILCHRAFQRRGRPRRHPGALGPQLDHHHPALLPGLQRPGIKGLLPGCAEDRGQGFPSLARSNSFLATLNSRDTLSQRTPRTMTYYPNQPNLEKWDMHV
jgi:hypothetical protein